VWPQMSTSKTVDEVLFTLYLRLVERSKGPPEE